MQITTVSVQYERKWNLDDYESAQVGVNCWAQLAPDDNPAEAYEALWKLAKAQVEAQSMPMLIKRNARRLKLPSKVLEALPKWLQDAARGITAAIESDVQVPAPAPVIVDPGANGQGGGNDP